jgi:hypothetical protein
MGNRWFRKVTRLVLIALPVLAALIPMAALAGTGGYRP